MSRADDLLRYSDCHGLNKLDLSHTVRYTSNVQTTLFQLPSPPEEGGGAGPVAEQPGPGAQQQAQDCLQWLVQHGQDPGGDLAQWSRTLELAEHLGRFAAATAVRARARVAQCLGELDVIERRELGAPAPRVGEREEFAGEHIAMAEGTSPRGGGMRLQWSQTLVDQLPVTLSLLEQGRIPQSTARLVADETVALDVEQSGALEELLWAQGEHTQPSVNALLPATVRRRLPRLLRQVTGDTDRVQQEQRTTAARAERGILCQAGPDDTAVITAVLSSVDAAALMSALDAHAGKLESDVRTLDARRADALVWLVTGEESFALWCDLGSAAGRPFAGARHWTVEVRVDLATVTAAGATYTEPGYLQRFGELTAGNARLLAQQAISSGGLRRPPRDPPAHGPPARPLPHPARLPHPPAVVSPPPGATPAQPPAAPGGCPPGRSGRSRRSARRVRG
jgi:hypothetical protein